LVPPSARNVSAQELEEVGEHAVRPQGDASSGTTQRPPGASIPIHFPLQLNLIQLKLEKSFQEMAAVFNAIWQERQMQTAQRLLPVQVLHFARHFPGQLVFGHQRRRRHLLSVQSVVQLVGHVQENFNNFP